MIPDRVSAERHQGPTALSTAASPAFIDGATVAIFGNISRDGFGDRVEAEKFARRMARDGGFKIASNPVMWNPELFRRIAGADFVQHCAGIEPARLEIPLLLPMPRALATCGERMLPERGIARGRGDEIKRR